jgi:hypothetical protein
MKKTLILALALSSCITAFGQGTVTFANNVTGVMRARVYGLENAADLGDPANFVAKNGNDASGTPAGTVVYNGVWLDGAGYSAQLWAGPDADNLMPTTDAVGNPVILPFRTGNAAGLIVSTVVTVPGVAGGGSGVAQMVAWDNSTGATWDEATIRGMSEIIPISGLGAPGGATPPNSVGLTSFNLFVVPEPSTIALGVLGLGALLVFRRRK